MIRSGTFKAFFVLSIPVHDPDELFKIISDSTAAISGIKKIEDIPVQWHIPSLALEKKGSAYAKLIPLLRSRIASGSDLLLPMGFAGAYNSLLLPEDLENELSWCFNNPWESGFHDLFQNSPGILFPLQADLLRETSRETYARLDILWMLPYIPAGSADMYCAVMYRGHHISDLPLVIVHNKNTTTIRTSLLRCRKRGFLSAVIFASYPEFSQRRSLNGILGELSDLSARKGVQFHSMTDYIEETMLKASSDDFESNATNKLPPRGDIRITSLPTCPASLFARTQFSYRRDDLNISSKNYRLSSRIENINAKALEIRQRLLATASKRNADTDLFNQTNISPEPRERTLIADMSGNAVLEDERFCANFSEGRLTGMSVDGSQVLSGKQVRSYLNLKGEEFHFTRISAFSFESNSLRGLREISRINAPYFDTEGSLMTDYFFVDGCSHLFADVTAKYPIFMSSELINSYGLFEFPVFEFSYRDNPAIEAKYPNGERYRTAVLPEESFFPVPGNAIALCCRETCLTVSIPESEKNTIGVMPIRISRFGRRYLISINPFGSYEALPSGELSGVQQHFTLMLSIESCDSLRYRPLRAEVYEELIPSWINLDRQET